MRLPSAASSLALALAAAAWAQPENSTYLNPVLPGWHSDPSCTQVDGTFFCVTSTFIAFPGLPVYASRDLINWKLASHAWNREAQLPGVSWATAGQQEGMFAATLRHRGGRFYVIGEYLGAPGGSRGVVFSAADAFDDAAWGDPVTFAAERIDPDLFWDDDGRAYVATQGILLQEIDLASGALSQPPLSIWNGTGGVWPEGPHLYRKDGWYYLLIAEGGTETNHAVTIARARAVTGPYEAYERNPVLTNRGTDEYFQTVGHADLFQDAAGNWWGMCLATRSGPAWAVYPMGREAVLFPVTWAAGAWPVLEPVRGRMRGWPLPAPTRELPGDGPFNSDPDAYDFAERGAALPRNLVHWRVPRAGAFAVAPDGRAGLRVVPSRANLTGSGGGGGATAAELSGRRGLAFAGRRQTHSLFAFSVDLAFAPRRAGHEAGVAVFLTQRSHLDLGVVRRADGRLWLRFRAEGAGAVPAPRAVPLPPAWGPGPVRLRVDAPNATHYRLSAGPARDGDGAGPPLLLAEPPAALVSGGSGSFVGSLVGVYATCNGDGAGDDCPPGGVARFTRWRYVGKGQHVSETEIVR
ncbi:glycoside hydrolase family 43 protein [Durotheca rogersii]|uniref:glycoside hydrolase family 43 protein n=1 Tax=Durotheca rogersii TaxID=419775 RepID=UPI00221E874C|nr:glycoside hydrolase family 43 protein [Durotheca rogersii]KAI5860780.1 glycoside hydrolase family 43 protein [Durotheca rogersii]